jgi:hypothetical protein
MLARLLRRDCDPPPLAARSLLVVQPGDAIAATSLFARRAGRRPPASTLTAARPQGEASTPRSAPLPDLRNKHRATPAGTRLRRPSDY